MAEEQKRQRLVYIRVEYENDEPATPGELNLPPDVTAQDIVKIMKKDSGDRPYRIVRDWDLIDQRYPTIHVDVVDENGKTTSAYYP